MALRSTSLVRQNYSSEAETAVNRQINLELYASNFYLSMQSYFERDDVALSGFAKFCATATDGERVHARKFMAYQNMRGGRIVLADIKKPDRDDWGSGLEAMQSAFQLEKTLNQGLLDLHAIAVKNNDAQFADFVQDNFLEVQLHEMQDIAEAITNLKRVGPGLGEYQFDLFSLLTRGAEHD